LRRGGGRGRLNELSPLTSTNEGIAVDQPASNELKQSRMTEFMKLLPLTLELAGLPKAETGRPFTGDQIEGRVMSIRTAFKAARALLKEVGDGLQ
jgi:hypothetical protein